MLLTDEEEHKATGSNLTYQDKLHSLRHLSVQIISKAKIGAVEAVIVAAGAKFTFFFHKMHRYSLLEHSHFSCSSVF